MHIPITYYSVDARQIMMVCVCVCVCTCTCTCVCAWNTKSATIRVNSLFDLLTCTILHKNRNLLSMCVRMHKSLGISAGSVYNIYRG